MLTIFTCHAKLRDVNAAKEGKSAGEKIKQGFEKAKDVAASAKKEASSLTEPLSDESPTRVDATGSKVSQVSLFHVMCWRSFANLPLDEW